MGEEYEQSFNAFPAFEVKIGNFSLRATHAPTLNVKAVIDVQFPLILIQATNPLEHEYYQGNLTALAGDVLFREYEGFENSVQAYFPQTDCADVAMRLQDFSLKFKSQGNFLFTINQGLYLYNQTFN